MSQLSSTRQLRSYVEVEGRGRMRLQAADMMDLMLDPPKPPHEGEIVSAAAEALSHLSDDDLVVVHDGMGISAQKVREKLDAFQVSLH